MEKEEINNSTNKKEKPVIYILYASQTGTSESESHLLSLQLEERNLKTEVSSLDDFPIEKLPEIEYCLFMVSTTGIENK